MRSLLTISGYDPVIAYRCKPRQQAYLYGLSIGVLFVGLFSVLTGWKLSIWAGSTPLPAILLGGIFSMMLTNLYRFMLTSIACRATYDRHLKLRNTLRTADVWRLGLLAMPGIVVAGTMLLWWHPATWQSADTVQVGLTGRLMQAKDALGWVLYPWLVLGLLLWWLPLLAKQYLRPLRNGEYEWLRNQFENQRIRDQYAYMKDGWLLILKEATENKLRIGFDENIAFIPDPFVGKLLDADARVNLPLAMAQDAQEYQGIKEAIEAQGKVGKAIQDCDFCGKPSVPVHLLESGLARCADCEAEALEDEDELHVVFAEALHFFESHHVQLPRYIRPRFATPKEIAAFNNTDFSPTPGFDSRPVGMAAAPHTTLHLDTIFIEKGFSRARVFATIIHELVHVWQFNTLNLDSLEQTGQALILMEGLARWAELDALEKHGEYQLVGELQASMNNLQDEYSLGYQKLLDMMASTPSDESPFEIYLKKFGK